MLIDMQSALIAEVIARLAVVPSFGAEVREDSVLRIIDAEDGGLADDLIVIQEGATEEVERVGAGSVKERLTLNLTAMTRRREYGPALRAGRLGIKSALAGVKAGLKTQGLTEVTFDPETPMPPRDGRRWACRVLSITVTYVQPLK